MPDSIQLASDAVQTELMWVEQGVPPARLQNDAPGRPWFLETCGFAGEVLSANLQQYVDGSNLDDEIVQRYAVTSPPAKKAIHMLKVELAYLDSYKKCFVHRGRTRLQYYRDDLSQKGARNMFAVGLSQSEFDYVKQYFDQ